ncbi:TM2 domain-containing protein 1 [Spea bombifrons]|uniref:TM2 domain-containing protein 1 n=1 Tax=Spea bombifrons TaxID=233779 RepID=UPI00234A1D1B|nr:TM2 domain-containing protein 1 [Spea bombifrons]
MAPSRTVSFLLPAVVWVCCYLVVADDGVMKLASLCALINRVFISYSPTLVRLILLCASQNPHNLSLIPCTYICTNPEINPVTQEPVRCSNSTAYAPCFPAPAISCKDYAGNVSNFTGKEIGFFKPFPCRNVNGYSYKVAVALSLFLGWLGADRFYLGYPALGMLKFCTVGFCGIGSLLDFILISMQIVGPSDGSSYIIDYYGARLVRLGINNETFRKTQLYP